MTLNEGAIQRTTQIVRIGESIQVGNAEPLLLIAGPCQIESREHALRTAELLSKITSNFPVRFVYKSSFDKANRTGLHSERGVGIELGLKILAEVRKEIGVPVITDIHLPDQAQRAAECVDVLQIPAFLCRQTDLLLAAGTTGKPLNVKKGQFLPPADMRFAIEKIQSTGNQQIMLCERGSTFGYRDLIVDMRSLTLMAQTGFPVIFDATHSVQSIGGAGGSSGGSREFIRPLVRAAIATGVSGLFIECHEDPQSAPSDGASMLPLENLSSLLSEACRIRSAALGT